MGCCCPLCEFCCTAARVATGLTQAADRKCQQTISQDPVRAIYRRRLLRSIELLHTNFYQEFLDEDSVRDGIYDAKELI